MMNIPTILVEKIVRKVREKQCDTITSGCTTLTTTDSTLNFLVFS